MKKILLSLFFAVSLITPEVSYASEGDILNKISETLRSLQAEINLGAVSSSLPTNYPSSNSSGSYQTYPVTSADYSQTYPNTRAINNIRNSLKALGAKPTLSSPLSENDDELINQLTNIIIRNDLYNIFLIGEINYENNYNHVCGANGSSQDPGIRQLISEINTLSGGNVVVCGKPLSGSANSYAVSAPLKPVPGASPYACIDINNASAIGITSPISATSLSCASVNTPPTITISSPTSQIYKRMPGGFSFIAFKYKAADKEDGLVTKIEFYKNGVKYGETVKPIAPALTTSPFFGEYLYVYNNLLSTDSGTINITLKAFDKEGASTVSNPFSIIIQ